SKTQAIVVAGVDNDFSRRCLTAVFLVHGEMAVVGDGQFIDQIGAEEVSFIQGQVPVVIWVLLRDGRAGSGITAPPRVRLVVPLEVGREAEPVVGAEIVVDPPYVRVLA